MFNSYSNFNVHLWININTAPNSGFTKCLYQFKPDADFPLENLILAENKLITNPQRQAKPREVRRNFKNQNNNLMNYTLKYLIYFVLTFPMSSCWSQISTETNQVLNTVPNSKYIESRKTFSGKFSHNDYKEIRDAIEKELNIKIPENKAILINYSQKAQNCISMRFDEDSFLNFISRKISISSDICSKNNAVDFFVFSDDSFYKEQYKGNKKFLLDSGFFYNIFFTLYENCEAFFILKPNGNFMKYYGEDYYTFVSEFLEKK